jgi:hypothetical protein
LAGANADSAVAPDGGFVAFSCAEPVYSQPPKPSRKSAARTRASPTSSSPSRALGVPAHYVSGYLHRPDAVSAQEGGHAWAEAHVPEFGWVGFDPAEGLCVTDRHIRIAIGLDGLGAARVRGAHYGGGREVLAVKLQVTQASWQTQG